MSGSVISERNSVDLSTYRGLTGNRGPLPFVYLSTDNIFIPSSGPISYNFCMVSNGPMRVSHGELVTEDLHAQHRLLSQINQMLESTAAAENRRRSSQHELIQQLITVRRTKGFVYADWALKFITTMRLCLVCHFYTVFLMKHLLKMNYGSLRWHFTYIKWAFFFSFFFWSQTTCN